MTDLTLQTPEVFEPLAQPTEADAPNKKPR